MIGCCVCLNHGVKRPAIIKIGARYQGCADHRALVDQPGFDIFQLQPHRLGPV